MAQVARVHLLISLVFSIIDEDVRSSTSSIPFNRREVETRILHESSIRDEKERKTI